MSIEYFSYCIISCFDRELLDVSCSAGMSLEKWRPKIPFSRTEKEFQLADVPVEPKAGDLFAKRIIFLASSIAEGTVMITNMSDGYSSLAYAVTRQLSCSCLRFQISKKSIVYPTNSFGLIVNGVLRRLVRAGKEDVGKWDFYDTGLPLGVEEVERYAARRVKDRVTREYVIAVAAKLGWPLENESFWKAREPAVYFEQQS